MSLETLDKALEENPELKASSETLAQFVDSPDFFEGFLTTKCTTSVGRFKSKLYKNEENLLMLIKKEEDLFKGYIQSKYKTLDDITSNKALASALGLSDKNGDTLAKACVEHGFLSSEIPDNHPISKVGGNPTQYIKPKIVGAEQAEKNLKKYVHYTYKTFADITRNGALASALGLSDMNTSTIVKACVEHGFLSSEIPDNHPIGKVGGLSWYISPEIVGAEQAEKNLKKYVHYTYKTLDDITSNKALASALGLSDRNRSTIVKALTEREFLSSEIPDNHPIGKKGHLSWYTKPKIVGAEQAEKNLKKYVHYTYKTLDDIAKNEALAIALGVKDKISVLRSKIAELGWLDSDGLRSHVNFIAPKNNLLEDIPKIYGKYAQEISKLRKELIDLKSQNSKYHITISPFSGFGKCYENFVGVLLALEHSRIEHQIKLETNNNEPFRVADFGTFDNGRKNYLTLEDLEGFFEVKSGVSISEHDKGQLIAFLAHGKNLVYILQDKSSKLAQRLKEIHPDLDVRTHSDLKGYDMVKHLDICSLFNDKTNFSSYKSTNAISRLERDLFSVYLYIKSGREKGENMTEEVVRKLLEGVYLQNDEIAAQLSKEYNINWLEKIEYNRMESIYLDGNTGRRYVDPRIVIDRLEKGIEREKKKAKQIEIKQLPKLRTKELYKGLKCWHIPLDDFHEQITNLTPEIYGKLLERVEMNNKHQNQTFSFSGYLPG